MTEGPFDRVDDDPEGSRVSGVGQGVQQSRPLLR